MRHTWQSLSPAQQKMLIECVEARLQESRRDGLRGGTRVWRSRKNKSVITGHITDGGTLSGRWPTFYALLRRGLLEEVDKHNGFGTAKGTYRTLYAPTLEAEEMLKPHMAAGGL